MNATLTIQVRVLGAQAVSQLNAMQKQVSALNAAGASSSASSAASMAAGAGLFARSWQTAAAKVATAWSGIRAEWAAGTNQFRRTTTSLGNVGQSLRRSGQQIMFGFTLPVALAGTAMMNWALDNERAMTQVRKVYGDFSYDAERVQKETGALEKTFELLSSRLGVNQAEVINIGAAWAGAGLAGRDLAEATKATMETMILGEMEAGKATEALISIMATWRTSTENDVDSVEGKFSELTDTLAILNAIENQTGARFGDLVDILFRAGGAARQAGIDIRTLAALGASLVPATGSGSAAGNALKTIISRIMAPTNETMEVLNAIGIVTSDPEWMGATVLGKIEQMSKKFTELDQANRNVVTSLVAGRWQLNRFEVMMEDLASGNGFYNKALEATSDSVRRQGAYLKELNTVLDSNPKKFEVMTNVLKNNLAKVMVQFIPIIIGFTGLLAKAAEAFNNLSPSTKAWVGTLIILVAVLGPILMLLGILVTTLKFVFEIVRFGMGVFAVAKFLVWLFASALAGIVNIGILALPVLRSMGTAMTQLAIAILAPTGALRVFLSKVWVTMLLAGDAVKVFASKVWVSMLLAGDALKAFVGRVWVSMLLTADAIKASAFGAFAGRVWVSMLLAGDAVKVFASKVWVSMLLAGDAVKVFASKVWVSMLLAGDAIAAAVAAAAATLGISVGALVAIVAGVVMLVTALFNEDIRNAIWGAVEWIGRAIWGLPRVFASALSSLLRVVSTAVMKIVDWLSYLNPFQRHSPSLVDNVKAGVATILNEYASLRGIAAHIRSAASAHMAFQKAIAGAQGGFRAQETAEQRGLVAEASPAALPAFDTMIAARSVLEADLVPLTLEIDKQARIVAKLTHQYDQLEAQLNAEQLELTKLERKLKLVDDAIRKSEETIDRYANAGIVGMRAFEDEIFANEMAQKRLRLAIMDLEDAGSSIEDIQSRMQALNGEMELLTGERQGLYLSGAGSDILGVYDEQIEAIRQQQLALTDSAEAINTMAEELAALERAAQRLELEKSIRFDEQLRQIDQLVEGLDELPFEEIIANIQKENAELARLRPIQDSLNASVEAQRTKVEEISFEHDMLKAKLDSEADKLAELEQAYSSIEQLISEMNSNMQEFASSAKSAKDALDGGASSKLDGLAGDYDVATGTGTLDTNSTLAEIEAFNAEQQKLLEEMLGDIPDPFAGIRQKWEDFKGWFANNGVIDWIQTNFSFEGIGNFFDEIGGFFQRNFSIEGLKNFGQEALGFLWDLGAAILNVMLWPFRKVVDFLWPVLSPIIGIFSAVWNAVYAVVSTVLGAIWAVVEPILSAVAQAFVWAWQTVIRPVLQALWGFFYSYIFPVFQLLAGVVQIVFMIIVRVIQGAAWLVIKVLQGLWWVVTHLGDIFGWLWTVVKVAWDVITGVISGAWTYVIYPVLSGIWGFIAGVLGPIFVWLWDKVVKPVFGWIGTQIKNAWDLFIKPAFERTSGFVKDKLGPVFKWLWENIVKPVWNNIKSAIKGAWDAIRPVFEAIRNWARDTLPAAWNRLKDVITGVWDAIVRGSKNFANDVIRAINGVIGGFNALADAVQWVGEKLGIDITINEIPTIAPLRLAKGGIPPVDDHGGLYSGVRAIVGEGSRVWPEYVIPTDPKYRDRARMLAEAAAHRVGLFAAGGTVGRGNEDQSLWERATGAVRGVTSSAMAVVKEAAREAARLAFAPAKAAAMAVANTMPSDFFKGFITKPIQMIEDWISGSDPEIKGDRKTLEGWKGRVGSFFAIMEYFKTTGVAGIATSIMRLGATTRGSGNTRASLHATGRAVDFGTQPPSVDSAGLLAIYRAFLPVRDLLTELIYSGPGGSNPRNPITAADHHNHVHVGLARGGMAQAQRIYEFAGGGSFRVPHGGDGILARIGEGRNDERVQILPLTGSASEGGGDTIIEIHGDLSFPNITSADDAEKLIENLKALAP